MDPLTKLKNLEQLKLLDLSQCPLFNESYMIHLTTAINLRSLNLAHKQVSNGMSHVTNLTNLEVLNLNHVMTMETNALEYLTDMKNLRELSIRNCKRIFQNGLLYLYGLSIEKLDISENGYGNFDADVVDILLGLTRLHSLNISGTSQQWKEIPKSLSQLVQLRVLHMGSCPGAKLSQFDFLPHLSDLQDLYLSNFDIDMNVLQYVSTLYQLELLRLDNITGNNGEQISHLSNLSKLTCLELIGSYSGFGEQLFCLKNLKTLYLKEMTEMTQLDLNSLNLLNALEVLHLINVRELSLNLSINGLHLPNLRKLVVLLNTFDGSTLSKDFLQKSLPKLEYLDIGITIVPIEALLNFSVLENLQTLIIPTPDKIIPGEDTENKLKTYRSCIRRGLRVKFRKITEDISEDSSF